MTGVAVDADTLRAPALEASRKQAVKFGRNLRSDLVLPDAVWRFREKGADKYDSVRSSKWVPTL